MINKITPYAFMLTIVLLLTVVGCGSEFAIMRTTDLNYLGPGTLDDIQIYSGNQDIIFDKVVPSETGTSGYKLIANEPPFIIPAHTPGQVSEYDSVTAELAIWFDAMIPPLIYKDNGRGVELITINFNIGLDHYLRHDHLLNFGIAATTFMEPYYLTRELSGKKVKPPKPRTAEGIVIEIDEQEKAQQDKQAKKQRKEQEKQAKKAKKEEKKKKKDEPKKED